LSNRLALLQRAPEMLLGLGRAAIVAIHLAQLVEGQAQLAPGLDRRGVAGDQRREDFAGLLAARNRFRMRTGEVGELHEPEMGPTQLELDLGIVGSLPGEHLVEFASRLQQVLAESSRLRFVQQTVLAHPCEEAVDGLPSQLEILSRQVALATGLR